MVWHLTEARRFLGEMAQSVEVSNPARLDAWLADYCKANGAGSVPTRTIQQLGPNGLRDQAAIQAAAAELEELGRARIVKDGKKKLVQVNPALLAGVAL